MTCNLISITEINHINKVVWNFINCNQSLLGLMMFMCDETE